MRFEKTIEEISRKGFSPPDVVRDLISVVFIAFHNRVNSLLGNKEAFKTLETEYLKLIEPYKKRDCLKLLIEAWADLTKDMEDNPYEDILGTYYLDLKAKSDRQYRGQFFTPSPVADLMVELTFSLEEIKEKGVITAHEPAAGAGIFPLRTAKWLVQNKLSTRSIRWILWEIDHVFFKIAYINTTLWNIPVLVIHGDTLKQERWGTYPNLPYLMDISILERGVAQAPEPGTSDPEVAGSNPASPEQLSLFEEVR